MRNWSWASWASIALTTGAVALIIVNAVLQQQNRVAQAEINQRQQFINQSVQLGRVYEGLLRLLAAAAVTEKDGKLRDLLTDAGFTLTVNPAPAPTADSTPAPSRPPYKR
jgi:hypothetical protein